MKLQHGLGGLEVLEGFPLDYEKRVFVEDSEKRIFGIHAAMMGLSASLRDSVAGYDLDAVPTAFRATWTWAHLRTGAETMHPFEYVKFRDYEKWLGGISAYLVEQGYLTQAELDAATARFREQPRAPLPDRAAEAVDEQVLDYLRRGDTPRRGLATPAFAVGDEVVVRNPPATEHTRLPGYLRGHRGRVERVFEGNYSYFVSTGGDGLGEPMPVYLVRFRARGAVGRENRARGRPAVRDLLVRRIDEGRKPMSELFAYPGDREEASAAQAKALEALLIEKGVITGSTVDKVLGYFESEMTPLNGKKIVARAWVDSEGDRAAGPARGHGGRRG